MSQAFLSSWFFIYFFLFYPVFVETDAQFTHFAVLYFVIIVLPERIKKKFSNLSTSYVKTNHFFKHFVFVLLFWSVQPFNLKCFEFSKHLPWLFYIFTCFSLIQIPFFFHFCISHVFWSFHYLEENNSFKFLFVASKAFYSVGGTGGCNFVFIKWCSSSS